MSDPSLRGPCIHGEDDVTLCVRCELDIQMHFAAELEAENERLRAVVETSADSGGAWFARAHALMVENDRLRAVVKAAKRLVRTNTTTDGPISLVAEVDYPAFERLVNALAALDVSGDMGDDNESAVFPVYSDRIQTRSETGELAYHDSVRDAFRYARDHPDVWKISWADPLNPLERFRLVRTAEGAWYNEPILPWGRAAMNIDPDPPGFTPDPETTRRMADECSCSYFTDVDFTMTDLACPIHGVNGTNPAPDQPGKR